MSSFPKFLPHKFIPILLYHQVELTTPEEDYLRLAVPPKIFEAQMAYLYKHQFTTCTLDEYINTAEEESPDDRKIVITFDDGYLDTYTNAFPILQKYGLSVTIFVTTDFLGTMHAWESCKPVPYMSWSHARDMLNHGISFGSHTSTHPDLTTLTDREVLQELICSRQKIEDSLGIPIQHLSYPYGLYNKKIMDLARETGYQSAYSVDYSDGNRFSLERFMITLKDNMFLFTLKASKWASRLRMMHRFMVKGYR